MKIESNEQDQMVKVCLTVIFSLGVVAVLVYMLFGSKIAVYASLGIYAFAFSLYALFAIRKLFVIASYKERLKRFEAKAEMSEEEKQVYNQKKSEALKVVNKTKKKEVFKAIFAGVFAIFAVVVLILF